MDVVVAEGRSARLPRAHGEGTHAHRPERADAEDRDAHPDEVGRRAGVAGASRPTARRSRSPACAAASATSSPSTSRRRRSPTSRTTTSSTTGRCTRPTASPSSTTRASAGTRSCSGSIWTRKKKTQLTFGTNDETAAQFFDDHTLRVLVDGHRSESAARPRGREERATSTTSWTLDLKNGELKQYTDTLGGILSPIVLNDAAGTKIAFITYYKGDYGLHTLDARSRCTRPPAPTSAPRARSSTSRRRCSTRWSPANQRQKKAFEKMFLEGRPPVNVGVTNNGDVFGGTEISFGDVLGDKQVNFFAASIAQYRTLSLSYVNLGKRFQYALQGYSQTQFFYGQLEGVFYDPSLAPFVSRDLAQATRTVRGGTAFGIYPINRYRRLEVSGGLVQLTEQYNDPAAAGCRAAVPAAAVRTAVLPQTAYMVPLSVAFVQETTVFREFGPLAGSTMRLRVRRRAEDWQLAVATDVRRRRALLPAARQHAACWRCGCADSRASARRPTSSTSAATRKCADTTI